MSHIHIPDGVLPFYWWLGGLILTFIVLYFLMAKMDRFEVQSRVPRAAMAAAFMLIAMSVPLGIIPLHLSMAVLTGILVGPGLGFLAVFVVNLILALVGHGGLTIVGLNTLVIGTEVIIGSVLFQRLARKNTVHKAAFLSVIPALIVSMVLMVGIVGTSAGLAEAVPVHDCDHDHGQEHEHEDEHEEHEHGVHLDDVDEAVGDVHIFTLTGWGALFLILLIGIILESGITALIVRYIDKIKPEFIYKGE